MSDLTRRQWLKPFGAAGVAGVAGSGSAAKGQEHTSRRSPPSRSALNWRTSNPGACFTCRKRRCRGRAFPSLTFTPISPVGAHKNGVTAGRGNKGSSPLQTTFCR